MDLTLIETLEKTTGIKGIKRDCKGILKKLSFKSEVDLSNVEDLVVQLYIFDMYEEALEAAKLLDDVVFTGDYTLFSRVIGTRAVAIKILYEQGRFKEGDSIFNTYSDTIDPEVYENLKYLLGIYDANIKAAIEEMNSKSSARGWKKVKLSQMIQYFIDPDFPIDKQQLEQDINELKNELRAEIK